MPPQEGGRRAAFGRRSRYRPRTAAALAAAEQAARPPTRCRQSPWALRKGLVHGQHHTELTTRECQAEPEQGPVRRGLCVGVPTLSFAHGLHGVSGREEYTRHYPLRIRECIWARGGATSQRPEWHVQRACISHAMQAVPCSRGAHLSHLRSRGRSARDFVAMVVTAAIDAAPIVINVAKPGRCRVCRAWYSSRQQITQCLRTHGVKLAPAKPGKPARRKRAGLRAAAREQRLTSTAVAAVLAPPASPVVEHAPRAQLFNKDAVLPQRTQTHWQLQSEARKLPSKEQLQDSARARMLDAKAAKLRAIIAKREAASGRRPA